MNKKAITGPVIAVLGILVLAIFLYTGVVFHYFGKFGYGTVVNGINFSGKTTDEMKEQLENAYAYKQIIVVDKNGDDYVIPMDSIGFSVDYSGAVDEFKKSYNPFSWGINVIKHKEFVLTPDTNFDRNLLEEKLADAPFMTEEKLYNSENTISIVMTDDKGYQIDDRTKDLIHIDKAVECVGQAVAMCEPEINLWDAGCYESIDNAELENSIHVMYDKINNFQSFRMIYEFPEGDELLDSSVTSNWITLDENGNFATDEEGNLILNQQAVKDYVADLALRHDTKGCDRTFISTSGKEIHFDKSKVLYGTTIDQDAEVKALIEAVSNGEKGIKREPYYISKAFSSGDDDVGNTYIEINLTEQHLYYYKRGELFMESDFVSGNLARGFATPQLFAYVRNKGKNITLIGEGYESFVYYWMGIWRGYGMHDATWRGKFGGQIYKTSGSHGCINLPLSFIKDFYPEVEVGTPLIMFYEPEESDKILEEQARKEEAARQAEAARKAAEEAERQRQEQEAAENPDNPNPENPENPNPEPQPEPQPEQPPETPPENPEG